MVSGPTRRSSRSSRRSVSAPTSPITATVLASATPTPLRYPTHPSDPMPDFSPSGILDLPATSAESLSHGDPKVIGWLHEWVQEGDLINRSDPSYDIISRAQEYIVGEQL